MAKNGNGTWKKTAEILLVLLVPLITVAVGYGILSEDVKHLDDESTIMCAKVDVNAATDHRQDLAIQAVQDNFKYLKESVDAKFREQKVDLDNHTILLENILIKVTK